MCDFGITALALMGASAGMQIMGQQQQAKAQQKASNYQAQIAQNNAVIAQENVREAQKAGAMEEQRQRVKMAQIVGSQRAGFASSGIDAMTGSAKEVQDSSASLGYQDLLTIRENTKAREKAFHQQSKDFTSQAVMSKFEGKNARTSANIASVGTFLDTASSMGQFAYKQGMFGSSGSSGVNYGSNSMAIRGGGYTGGGSMTTLGR